MDKKRISKYYGLDTALYKQFRVKLEAKILDFGIEKMGDYVKQLNELRKYAMIKCDFASTAILNPNQKRNKNSNITSQSMVR